MDPADPATRSAAGAGEHDRGGSANGEDFRRPGTLGMRPQRLQHRRLHGRRLGGDLPPDPRQPRERGLQVRPRRSAPSTRAATVRAPSGRRARTTRRALLRCGRSPRPAAAAGWAGGPPLVPRGRRPTLRRDPSRPETAIANTPPGRSALAQSRSVATGDGTWLRMKARVTTSKPASGNGGVGAPATSQREAASGRAVVPPPDHHRDPGSTAVTTAPRRVAAAASRPVPEPTSRTWLPPSSRRRSATASSSGSTTPAGGARRCARRSGRRMPPLQPMAVS